MLFVGDMISFPGRDLGPGSKYRSIPRVQLWEEIMCTYFEGGSWEEVNTLDVCYAKANQNDPACDLSTWIGCKIGLSPRVSIALARLQMAELYTLTATTSTNMLPPQLP